MAKPKYIQGKNGKFAGSVGPGRDDLPASGALLAPPVPPIDDAAPNPGVDRAWESYASQHAEPALDDDDLETDDLVRPLQRIDDLGLDAANKMMALREAYVRARTGFSFEGQSQADALRERTLRIRIAVLEAREELRQARAHVEGEYLSSSLAGGATEVIDADCLSVEAQDLSELILDQELNGAAAPSPQRLAAANRHIRAARKLMKDALKNY